MPRHLLRSMSFWLGLPAFLFLVWAWRDSMHRTAAWHIAHGTAFSLRWPPVDTTHFPRPDTATVPDLEPLDFDITTLPGELGPLSPVRPHPTPIIDDPFRNSNLTPMHPYRTIGSKEGTLWFSSWISPRKLSAWQSSLGPNSGTWFPALDWNHTALTRSSTVWIPYWLLAVSYLVAWIPLMTWRVRHRRRRSSRFAIEP